MHPGQRQAELEVMRWAERHPDANKIPPHVETYMDTIKRYQHMDSMDGATIQLDRFELSKIHDELVESLPSYSARREAEQDLAIYIDGVGTSQLRPDFYFLAEKLNTCRHTGPAGIKPDGGLIIAWDRKCGQVRLCPDESREETNRLSDWYYPPMIEFTEKRATQRLFYAVFTLPNVAPGELAAGQKNIFDEFKKWRDKQGEKLKGALVIQEAPLSYSGDWNVHLNVFLMVHGAFSYEQARKDWGGYNIEFYDENKMVSIARERLGRPDVTFREALRYSLREAIKYSVQTVPEKSDQHATAGASDAPALTQWPHDRFVEWWDAGRGFRRVRSYGALYGLHRKRWDAMDTKPRIDLYHLTTLATLDIAAGDVAGTDWTDLTEIVRSKLRRVMTHGEPLDMALVQWVGAVNLNDDLSYWVDLILGDNFSGNSARRVNDNFDFYNFRGSG